MLILRKRTHSSTSPCLTVDGTALLQVAEYRYYLGVTITSNLSWKPHITKMCNKTRKLIGLLYRRFYRNSNLCTLLKLYLSFIRPHLEYSSAVWNPHLKGEVEMIEKVQKYALRMCTNSWELSYDESRRTRASLCHLLKIVHGLTDFPEAPISRQLFHYNSRPAVTDALTVPHLKPLHISTHSFPQQFVSGINNYYQDNSLNVRH